MITTHEFEVTRDFTIDLPDGYEVLTAEDQYDEYKMWVKLDTESPTKPVRFVSYGTGNEIDPSLKLEYISTFRAVQGMFVYHLFEVLGEQI